MEYTYKEEYILNLILLGTFSFEVSHSMPLVKGTFDCRCSTKHTAQNFSNLYLALENDLEIIPVLNKVDLPSANPEVSD
jgi:GTP-binding protein LepA